MFFMSKGTIPEGVGFSTFGVGHLIWLFAIIVGIVAAAFVYKGLNSKHRKIMRLTVGALIVFLEITKDIYHIILGEFSYGYLPFHLCGINILLIAFDMIKPTKIVRNFLYYFAIAGAALALIFPNWTQLPFWNFSSIHSFSIHALLIMYPVLLVAGGELTLDVKTMPKCILLLILMAIPIYFMNMAWGTNFMFLMEPDKGNPLEMFEKLLGSHLWGFPILLPVVMFLMYIPIAIIKKKKSPKTTPAETEEKETVTM